MKESTDRTKVVILTNRYHIIGEIAHFPEMRLTDFMIEAKSYIAVINAKVLNDSGQKVLSAPFLNVRNDHIEVIMPAEES
jgi:hypothetical protein